MPIKVFFRLSIILMLVAALASCMPIAGGFIRIFGIDDIDRAFEQTGSQLKAMGFVYDGEGTNCVISEPRNKTACYALYPSGYDKSKSSGRRMFTVYIMGERKKKEMVLFFRELYVEQFTTEGKNLFGDLITRLRDIFDGSRIEFGTDKSMVNLLWKEFYRHN